MKLACSAIGFVNLLHLYSPELIVVGGGLGTALDLMAPRIAQTVRERALPAFRAVPIVPAALGRHAGLVGAASLVFDQGDPSAKEYLRCSVLMK